ncbi:unnamed protein product [Anisakis simplex]|uniref:Uncharacterized protein n=1 Tax=Anisakis simplex TaxID=6269 RepID=A0A0M3JN07_ANISI|nr:unnamed protein product [Anisakis simplex]
MVLREVITKDHERGEILWSKLSERCRKEVHMLRASSFTRTGPPTQLPTERCGFIPSLKYYILLFTFDFFEVRQK